MRKELAFKRVVVSFIVFSLIFFQSSFFSSNAGSSEVLASEVNHISENTIWEPGEAPYVIDGELVIDQNVTLTVVPGTVVTFTSGSRLTVDGFLSAGTDNSQETVFTSVYDPEYSGVEFKTSDYWDGIYISETGYFDGIRIKASYAERIFNVKGSLNLNQSKVNNAKYNCVYINQGGSFNGVDTLISDVASAPVNTPTIELTYTPTAEPTSPPTIEPTNTPAAEPTSTPTVKPTGLHTIKPTGGCKYTPRPTCNRTTKPTCNPTYKPPCKPTCNPTYKPPCKPTCNPTYKPTCNPTYKPPCKPTCNPTYKPPCKPTGNPTYKPTCKPTCNPTYKPPCKPTCKQTYNSIVKPNYNPTCNLTIKSICKTTCKQTIKTNYKPACNQIINPNYSQNLQPNFNPTYKPTCNQKPIMKPCAEHKIINEANPCNLFGKMALDKRFGYTVDQKAQCNEENCVKSKKLIWNTKLNCNTSNSNSMCGYWGKYKFRDLCSNYPKCCPKPTCHVSTPTVMPTAEPKNTLTPVPTSTQTPEPTNTPTAEPTSTPTPEPTSTSTPEPTSIPVTIPLPPADVKDSCIVYNEGVLNLTSCDLSDCSNIGIYVENNAEFNGGDLNISNCETGVFVKGTVSFLQAVIENCYNGVYSLSEKPVSFEYCTFNNISSYAIINAISSNTLTAINNYWQSANGPSVYDPETNTWKGEGLKILGNITYEPFLTEPEK